MRSFVIYKQNNIANLTCKVLLHRLREVYAEMRKEYGLQEAAAANYYYFDLISWICDPLKEKEIILRNKNREVYYM